VDVVTILPNDSFAIVVLFPVFCVRPCVFVLHLSLTYGWGGMKLLANSLQHCLQVTTMLDESIPLTTGEVFFPSSAAPKHPHNNKASFVIKSRRSYLPSSVKAVCAHLPSSANLRDLVHESDCKGSSTLVLLLELGPG
jgi:hypothetical protein